jgi:hypothetical protein
MAQKNCEIRDYYITREKYQRILNNIISRAPIECGVQTLVYMLVDEIVNIKYPEQQIKLLVADLRKGKKQLFGGYGGIIDLCLVDGEFMYREENQTGFEEMKKSVKVV